MPGGFIAKPAFTVQDAIESGGFHAFQYVLCAISGLSWIATGTEIMLLAVMAPSLQCEWPSLSSFEQALSTTFVFFGWMVSSPIWGRVCDVRGRRQGMIIASFVGFVFGILNALAPNFYLFLGARFGVGFAIGALAQSVTLTAEFLPSKNRARILIILKCFFALGAALIAALAMVVLPGLGWRWLVAAAAVPLALFGLCSWARATLDRIARFNGTPQPEGELIAESEEPSKGFTDLLKPAHRRTTIQLALFGFLYIGLAVYTSLLMPSLEDRCSATEAPANTRFKREQEEPCRLLTMENYIDIIVTTMSEVPGYIITAFAIDIIGRKATFAVGFGLFSICSAAMAFCLPRFLIVTALFIGRSAIGAVWQEGYIYTSEVYPTPLRAQGLGVTSSWGRLGAMTTPIVTQMVASLNLIFPAILFSAGGIVAVFTSILLPIETSVKSKKKGRASKKISNNVKFEAVGDGELRIPTEASISNTEL